MARQSSLLGCLEPGPDEWPYQPVGDAEPPEESKQVEVPLVPYNRWANRGPSSMRVWLPTV